MKYYVFSIIVFVLVGCSRSEQLRDVNFIPLPDEGMSFFHSGIEDGTLYSYITKDGRIFVIRRDLKKYAWLSIEQFEREVRLAESRNDQDWIIYTLEDRNLSNRAVEDAFSVLSSSNLRTQDPLVVHPFALEN